MSDGLSAQGTLVAYSANNPSSPSFTTVAELRDITPPTHSRNPLETTNHNETEETFVMGILRKGELQFQLNWVPTAATHGATTGVHKALKDKTLQLWKVTFPEATYWLFSGYVQSIGPSAPVDDVLVSDVVVRPTGAMIIV